MKKLLLIPFLLLVIIFMAACGIPDNESVIPEQPGTPEQPGEGDDNNDNSDTPTPGGNRKYLVLYASRTSNTERVAILVASWQNARHLAGNTENI